MLDSEDTNSKSTSPDVVIINVSPLEFGASLLLPQMRDCLPQVSDYSMASSCTFPSRC